MTLANQRDGVAKMEGEYLGRAKVLLIVIDAPTTESRFQSCTIRPLPYKKLMKERSGESLHTRH